MILEVPGYGSNKYEVLKDISVFTNSEIICDVGKIKKIPRINEVRIDKEKTILINDNKDNNLINNRIKELEKEVENSEEYLVSDIKERISKLKNGIGIIYVGAQTKLEKREKKMRIEDSVNSVIMAKDGVIVGEGLSFLSIKDKLDEKNTGFKILKESLEVPFLQIMDNAGVNGNEIISNIKKNNYKSIYNIKEEKYENIEDSSIIDPTLVVITSFKNAVSIASMLLTTKCVVINDMDDIIN